MENTNIDYNFLDDSTKLYLNKAMDIYLSIKNYEVEHENESIFMTNTDKIVISLFLSGFLTDGFINNILEKYCGVKKDQVLDFIGLTEKDIKSVDFSQYISFYNEHFKNALEKMAKEELRVGIYNIKIINSEVIFNFLRLQSICNSLILGEIFKRNGMTSYTYNDKSFVYLENYLVENDFLEENDSISSLDYAMQIYDETVKDIKRR